MHHVYREQNQLADGLVVMTSTTITIIMLDNSTTSSTTLFWEPPTFLLKILRADKYGAQYLDK